MQRQTSSKGVSLRTALYAAFGVMVVVSAVYGLWSVYALKHSERIVRHTYDHALMTINYARAAEANTMRLLRADVNDEAFETVLSDLDVVVERSDGGARKEALAIRAMISGWKADGIPKDAAVLGDEAFLVLTEQIAAQVFLERQTAIDATSHSVRLALWGLGLILLISVVTAAGLARLLVRPLEAFSKTAVRIAEGRFDVPVPRVFGRELVSLRRSVEVMQAKIARRIAEEERTREWAETRLAATLDGAADAIVILDADDRVLLRNKVAASILEPVRLDEGAHLPGTLEDAGFSPDERRALLFGGEMQLGSGLWLAAAPPQRGEHGRVLVWTDATAFKAREESLRLANEAKARFIAVMGHELRTPLNAVIGFADLMAGEALGPLGDDQYKGFASQISESGSKLLGLINDILQFSNVQGQDYQETFERLDPAPLLEAAAGRMRRHVLLDEIELSASIPRKMPPIDANMRHIQRGLEHLILNAARFSPPGARVEVIARVEEDGVLIEVRDHGRGMTRSELEKALALFEQVDSSATREHEGLGLGIPLARAIVEAHQGTLMIESEPGEGTAVTIDLPRADVTRRKAG